MHLKDYYKILELEPSATLPEIKKAYWRLAQIYHPDKKQDDPYAAALFAEIKEAYETLTNPTRKDHYLQQRWYHQTTGSRRTAQTITPVSILKQSLELNKYVSTLDVHRMDKEGLYEYMISIVSDETVQRLNQFRDESAMKEIIRLLADSGRLLSVKQFEQLSVQMKKLTGDPATLAIIDQQQRHLKNQQQWNRWKPWLLLLVVALISAIIILSAD
jgi:curved DNA-binding protein CbpA